MIEDLLQPKKRLLSGLVGAGWFLPALPWILAGVAAVIGALGIWVATLHGRITTANLAAQTCRTEFATHLLADAQAKADDEASARAKEHIAVAENATTVATLQERNDALQAELEESLRRRGTVERKLRDNLSCASLRGKQLPDAAAAVPPGDGEDQAGIQPADEEFLIRLAGRADVCANTLAACQDSLVTAGKTCNGQP